MASAYPSLFNQNTLNIYTNSQGNRGNAEHIKNLKRPEQIKIKKNFDQIQ